MGERGKLELSLIHICRASFGQKYYDRYAKPKEGQAVGTFKPRLTRPEAGNKYYITKASGGWSDAIKGKPVDALCNTLSNCVGYAYGRFNEIDVYKRQPPSG